MLNVVLFISKGISCLMHRLAKSCLALFVWILSCIRVLNVWTVSFNINGKFCKYTGNVVCTYLKSSFNSCNFSILVTLRIFSFLNNGSACALYCVKHIILIAFFCSLIILLQLIPHTIRPWLMFGNINELYKVTFIFSGKNPFNLFNMPINLENLIEILIVNEL